MPIEDSPFLDYDMSGLTFSPQKASASTFLEPAYLNEGCSLALSKHLAAGWHAIPKSVHGTNGRCKKRPMSAVLASANTKTPKIVELVEGAEAEPDKSTSIVEIDENEVVDGMETTNQKSDCKHKSVDNVVAVENEMKSVSGKTKEEDSKVAEERPMSAMLSKKKPTLSMTKPKKMKSEMVDLTPEKVPTCQSSIDQDTFVGRSTDTN